MFFSRGNFGVHAASGPAAHAKEQRSINKGKTEQIRRNRKVFFHIQGSSDKNITSARLLAYQNTTLIVYDHTNHSATPTGPGSTGLFAPTLRILKLVLPGAASLK